MSAVMEPVTAGTRSAYAVRCIPACRVPAHDDPGMRVFALPGDVVKEKARRNADHEAQEG